MKRLILSVSLVFTIGIVLAQSDVQSDAKTPENAPEITFDKSVYDYGTLEYGADGTTYFPFSNTGNEPLILQKPRSSCGCTVPSWPKTPILPGESDSIKVTYNTKKVGTINKTVTVVSNAKNSTVVLRIKGKVEPMQTQQVPEKSTSAGAPVNKGN